MDGRLWTAVGIPATLPAEEAARRVLDAFQDAAITRAGGAPIPACPEPNHPHPATARVEGATVAWRCPSERGGVATGTAD